MKITLDQFSKAYEDFTAEMCNVHEGKFSKFKTGFGMALLKGMYILPGLGNLLDNEGKVEVDSLREYIAFGIQCAGGDFEIPGIPVNLKQLDIDNFFDVILPKYTQK